MGFDFFTIRNLAAELGAKLGGQRIERALAVEGQLGMAVEGGGLLHAVLARDGWVCWDPGPMPESLVQGGTGEPYLLGTRVEKVWADTCDRLLWLRLSRPDSRGEPSFGRLVFELIHPCFQAYLTSERNGRVLRCWGGAGRPRLAEGSGYTGPPSGQRFLPGGDSQEGFVASLAGKPVALRGVASKIVGMDEIIAAQILARLGVAPVGVFAEEDLRAFWREASALYSRPAEVGGAWWTAAGRYHFSGLSPSTHPFEACGSVSEAIRRVQRPLAGGIDAEPDKVSRRLRGAGLRLQRRLSALEADLAAAADAEHCQRQAMALLAGLTLVPRGAKRVELPDPYGPPGQTTVVDLDPERPAAETAARLARAAQRFRRRQEVLPGRIHQVRGLLAEVEELLGNPTCTEEQRKGWLRKNAMDEDREHPRSAAAAAAHPRRYRTSTGWSVWAGRNNVENDLLSHRLAAQNDFWFHAHGYPGSHVVLRREGRKEEPSAQTLREAAAVAAYWSKGKTAKKVSVVYTLVKYVSKPRGGAPGQALLKREKSLMVEPRLLPEEDQSGG